jgi:nucleoid-associated protein
MQVREAILHRISKEKNTTGADSATTQKRPTRLAADKRLERTVEDILKIYGKSTSGYGTFNTNETVYRFPVLLKGYVTAGEDFIAFTNEATDLIAAKMGDEPFSTGGYALFLRYTNQGQDWMLVAMLKLKPGTGVNEQTLELSDTLSLDIDHLHEAARVDLGKWQAGTQPYLSFIKKRQSGAEVSRYFREALGCTEYTDSKHHTAQMRDAFDAYSADNSWTQEQKRAARQRIYDYCDAKEKAGESVNLSALSALIDDQNPGAFSEYVRDNDFEVGETFKPHKATYTRFKRISRTFGSVKVSFDVQDLLNGGVDFDEDNACLVINNLPQELIDEIKKHKATDDEPVAD